jgi:hypothetical protein
MARAQTEALLEREPDVAAQQAPVLFIAYGRGQSGKSSFTRLLIDRARNAGREVIAADGDRSNATLTSYYRDASRPQSADDPDMHEWITGLVERMANDRVSVALDCGGGDRVMQNYSAEFPLLGFCREHGIRLVIAYFVAPNVDSLAPINTLEKSGIFRDADTIVVLNQGLVPVGKTPESAFQSVQEHEAFRSVLEHAKLIVMPKLGCMSEMERRRTGFFEADFTKLGPMNAFMVKDWRARIEKVLEPVADWLP